MANVSYRKLSYHIWKLRYYRAGPLEPGDTSSEVPLYRIKIKSVLFMIGNLLFHEGDATVHLRTSSSQTMVWGNVKEVSKSYLHMVFFLRFGRPPLWKTVQRTSCRGSQFLHSNNEVCKKNSPKKEFNSNIWHSTCSFSSEKQSQRDSLRDSNFLKNTFEWIKWVNVMVEDLFILQPFETVCSFRDFAKDLSPKSENISGYLL